MKVCLLFLTLVFVGQACGGNKPGSGRPNAAARQANPTPVNDLLIKARAATKRGDTEAAEVSYREAYRLDPTLEILSEEIQMLLDHGKGELANAHARESYEADRTNEATMVLYGKTLIATGDLAKAVEITDAALAINDSNVAAQHERGQALALLGRFEEAIEALRRAATLSPDDADVLADLGSALMRVGKLDEGVLVLRSSLKRDPDSGRVLMLLGIGLRDQAEFEEAEVYLTKATRQSRDARPWFELGILQNKRGDDLGAEGSLAKAVKLEPGNSLYQYAYGEMLRFNKKFDQAIDAYRTASQLQPPYPKASAKLGVVFASTGRFDQAEIVLTDAIRKDPSNAYNYYNLASVYRLQKKSKLAIDMYEQFIERADKLDGDRPKAVACVASLKANRSCDEEAPQRESLTPRPQTRAPINARVIEAIPAGSSTKIRLDRGAGAHVAVGTPGVLMRKNKPAISFTISAVTDRESVAVVKASPSEVLEARDAVLTPR